MNFIRDTDKKTQRRWMEGQNEEIFKFSTTKIELLYLYRRKALIVISIVIEHDFCSAISVEIKGRRRGGGDLSILEIEVYLSECTCHVS